MMYVSHPGKFVYYSGYCFEGWVYDPDFSKSAPLLRANRFSAALPGAMHSEECIAFWNELDMACRDDRQYFRAHRWGKLRAKKFTTIQLASVTSEWLFADFS